MFIKCPYNRSVLQVVLRLVLMVLGTVGLLFFNVWVATAYLIYYIAFFFFLMPVMHCQYCYYKVKEPTKDGKKSLLPKEKWKECYLEKHVACGKKWAVNFFFLWFLPIILIIISLFLSFSIIALLFLIGFIVVLAISLIHMRLKVCPTCAIMEECHTAF